MGDGIIRSHRKMADALDEENERLIAELELADRVRICDLMREDGYMEKRTPAEAWEAAGEKARWLWAEVERQKRMLGEELDRAERYRIALERAQDEADCCPTLPYGSHAADCYITIALDGPEDR